MKKGNVLVIGNSGVGKSTLINAVLGENCAATGYGTKGTTGELKIYENDEIPFRLIDTVGFEPSFLKRHEAINAVKKWSKKSAKQGNENTQINTVWFCVDGNARKLFPKTLSDLSQSISMWPSVPVVVVITKSYSISDRAENIEMVKSAFNEQKRHKTNLKRIIPVVASTYVLNESAFAAPEGITELIDATNELLPQGIAAAASDISAYKLKRKRAFAHSIVGAATTSGIVVGAVPIPFSDAALLGPIEALEVESLARLYGIRKNTQSKQFFNAIVHAGTVSLAAKAAISALKAIPGINLGAAAINAVIAGSIVAALGEGSIFAFEQVYLGKKTLAETDWVTAIIESRLTSGFVEKVTKALQQLKDNGDEKAILKLIQEIFNPVGKRP